jgi:hypothetical protein
MERVAPVDTPLSSDEGIAEHNSNVDFGPHENNELGDNRPYDEGSVQEDDEEMLDPGVHHPFPAVLHSRGGGRRLGPNQMAGISKENILETSRRAK